MKKTNKKKQKDNSMKFLCMFIVLIAFSFAFALLISKQQKDEYLDDIKGNNSSFYPQVGKVIVAKDLNAIYPKYYVVNINDGEYAIYEYNYYETISQYNLEFNRLIDKIVDYNAKDKMIRCLHSRGYGDYYALLDELPTLVGSNNLKVY